MGQDLNKNKENAISFYKMAYLGNPRQAIEQFVGDEYIQHNPDVGDGKEPFIDYFERMHKEYEGKSIELECGRLTGDHLFKG